MIVKCSNCNIDLNRSKYDLEHYKNFYCSKSCAKEGKFKKGRSEATCGYCKNTFMAENHKIKSLKDGKFKNLFCCKEHLQLWQKDKFSIKHELICGQCGESFESKNREAKFCSKECTDTHKTIDIQLECDLCGNTFNKKPSAMRTLNFCGTLCVNKFNSLKKNDRPIKKCPICTKNFNCYPSQKEYRVCCSKKCMKTYQSTLYLEKEGVRERLIKQGINSTIKSGNKETKPERIVRLWLESNNIKFLDQHKMYDKFIVDFYLSDSNTVIEVLGDYWHGNPDVYGEGDNLKSLTDKQMRQKAKDKSRYAYLTACGHNVLMIWEADIYKDIEFLLKHFKK